MTEVRFYVQKGLLTGFEMAGHSTSSADDEDGRLVCSAVSSAAFMAANTLTEVVGASAETEVSDGHMCVRLTSKLDESQIVLRGFELHLYELAKQYRNHVKVYSEV